MEKNQMVTLEIQNLVKKYAGVEVLKQINLSIKTGELFGLIGPDGAGKTTLMRAICTLLVPDEGKIIVQGYDISKHMVKIRNLIGYMPQRFSLYQDLTVEQNLSFFAELFQVPAGNRAERLQQLYQFSRLAPFKKRAAGALSGGMKQKLALSCALIHTPELLVLDEPTFGVDPVSRIEFWDILRSIQGQGTTIVVSTAYMDEANQCDRVALLFNGEIKALDEPKILRSHFKFPLYRLQANDLRNLLDFFQSLPNVHTKQLFGDALHVSFEQEPSESSWLEWQKSTHGNLQHWQKHDPSIEDVFLEVTGSEE
jgi:ABC-2 type transport system ATP-binding protein